MTTGDMPHIGASNYTSTAYGLGAVGGLIETTNTLMSADQQFKVLKRHIPIPLLTEILPMTVSTRFVRVIIVDPNENISLEDRIIYKGDEKATDLNDQELFFELDIKALLSYHNEKRTKVIDKKVKERTEYLEPAKIRDLKMVVVNIATF